MCDLKLKRMLGAVFLGMCCTATSSAQVTSLNSDEAYLSEQEESAANYSGSAKNVFVIGKAPIYGGDLVSARKIALQVGYAEAIAQGAGLEIGSLTLIKNVQQVVDLVTSRGRGVITHYEIIQENISEDGTLLTLGLEAKVETVPAGQEGNEQALQLLLGVLGNPRILILMPQYDAVYGTDSPASVSEALENISNAEFGYLKTVNGYLPAGALRGTEAAFSERLNHIGYITMTPDMAGDRVEVDLLARARNGETLAAIEVARILGADIVLVGTLNASTKRIAPAGVSFESVSAEFSARALVTATGREIETFYEVITTAHINMLAAIGEAKKQLAQQMAEKLAWKIPKVLGDSPNIFQLQVDGLSGSESVELQDRLRSAFQIESVELTQLPDKARNTAEYEMRTGFVRIPPSRIFALLKNQYGASITVLESNPFFLKLRRNQS